MEGGGVPISFSVQCFKLCIAKKKHKNVFVMDFEQHLLFDKNKNKIIKKNTYFHRFFNSTHFRLLLKTPLANTLSF